MTTNKKFDEVLYEILKLASLEAMQHNGLITQVANIVTAAETVVGCKIADELLDANVLHEVIDADNPKPDRGISVELTTQKNGKQIFIRMSGRHDRQGLQRFDRVEIIVS